MEKMEVIDLILEEVRAGRGEQKALRAELNQHIQDEAIDFKEIRKDINCLKTQSAVHKATTDGRFEGDDKKDTRQSGYINAAISAVVAGIVSFIAVFWGPKL